MSSQRESNDYFNLIRRSIAVLPKRDQKRLFSVFLAQMFLGFLDLIGIFLIGLVSALAVSSVSGSLPSELLLGVLNFFGLSNLTSQHQAVVLGGVAATALILKTLLTAYFSRRILFFLSLKAAHVSGELVSKFLNRPLQLLTTNSLQSNLYALTTGVQSVLIGIVGSLLLIASDIFLVVVLVFSLAIVDTGVAILSILIFVGTGFILYRAVHARAERNGAISAEMNILSNQTILEVFSGYREILVRNRRNHYASAIREQRLKLASALAESAFIPSVGKYTIEIVIVISGLIITGYQFWLNSATEAVGVLSVYLVASSRMAPAVLRIQQSAVSIKTSLGVAAPTLNLIGDLASAGSIKTEAEKPVDQGFEGFNPRIELKNLTLKYPNASYSALDNVSLEIEPGSFVGIVGESGAGKSSLMDCMLGVLKPDSGEVSMSGVDPLEAFNQWPGAVGYVPQNVFISNGTIKDNITLGFDSSEVADSDIRECIELAQLGEFIESLPLGLDTPLHNFESQLSGGQLQRLGIARALFTKPKLILLDEATSALDGRTEQEISKAIQSLKGRITFVVIAHRLSTVRQADKIVYLSSGKILTEGTFDEVRSQIPEFKHQADLMGL